MRPRRVSLTPSPSSTNGPPAQPTKRRKRPMDKIPHGPWRTADAASYDDSLRITHCDSPPSSTPPTPPAASRATACAPRAGRARWRMLHPARIERGSPALLVVPRELEIVALASHADRDPADAGPAVEPGAQGVERPIVRGSRKPGEAERRHEESAALVEHAAKLPGQRCNVNVSACGHCPRQ